MRRHSRWTALIIGFGLVALLAACETDTTATDPPAAPATSIPATAVATQIVSNELVDDHDDPTVEAHIEDVHDEPDEAAHDESVSEADEHAHGEGMVDPDAPIVHVIGSEFGYSPVSFDVEAGHAFTVMLHNEGALEHDITIEGFEEMGGIHLIGGEDGMNTFMLEEPGEYTYYCTVPGHRDAGMTGTITIEGHGHGEEEVHAEGDEHVEDEHHEEGDEHEDEEHAEDDHADEPTA